MNQLDQVANSYKFRLGTFSKVASSDVRRAVGGLVEEEVLRRGLMHIRMAVENNSAMAWQYLHKQNQFRAYCTCLPKEEVEHD